MKKYGIKDLKAIRKAERKNKKEMERNKRKLEKEEERRATKKI